MAHGARDTPVQGRSPAVAPATSAKAVRLQICSRGQGRRRQLIRDAQQVVRGAPQILGKPGRIAVVFGAQGAGIQPIIFPELACGPFRSFPAVMLRP